MNGDSLEQLTFEGRNFFPTWSSSGKEIAFDALIETVTNFYCIWKIKNDGSGKTLIVKLSPEYGDIRMPYWTGDKIIHVRYLQGVYSSEVFTMDAEGEDLRRLTFNEASDYYPKFSARGKLVFSSKPRNVHRQIWTMDADGANLKQLTDTQAYSCDWSPDGNYIVYTDTRRENGRLWIMDEDGSAKRQLTFEYHFIN